MRRRKFDNHIYLALFKSIYVNVLILVLADMVNMKKNRVKYLQGINFSLLISPTRLRVRI